MSFLPGLSNFLFGKDTNISAPPGFQAIFNNPMMQGWMQNLIQSGGGIQDRANQIYGNAYSQSQFAPSLNVEGFNQATQNPLAMGAGLLSQAANYDPMAAAQGRYNVMESILQPSRQQAWNDITQGLFSSGQLGSAGDTLGNRTLMSLGSGIENQQQQNLLNAIAGSEATQNMMYNQGIGLGGLGLQTQQGGLGLLGMGLNQQNAALGNQLGALNAMGIMPNIYQNLMSSALGYQGGANTGAIQAAANSGRSGGLFQGLAPGIGMGMGELMGGGKSLFGAGASILGL